MQILTTGLLLMLGQMAASEARAPCFACSMVFTELASTSYLSARQTWRTAR